MHNPSSPTGPRACVLPVEIPTSVPKPYLNPSANLVEAFANTPAESTPREKVLMDEGEEVRIVSVCFELCVLMWVIASERESTTMTDSSGPRCSMKYVSLVEGLTFGCGSRAERDRASAWRVIEFARRRAASEGQRVGRTDECRMRVSRELQAAM